MHCLMSVLIAHQLTNVKTALLVVRNWKHGGLGIVVQNASEILRVDYASPLSFCYASAPALNFNF